MRILVAEDDPNTAEFVTRLLRPYSSVVFTVESLQELFDQVRIHTFDVVILDLRLVDSAVLATIASIPRIRELQPDAGIVVMSGAWDVEENKRLCLQNGADIYLPKQEMPIHKALISAIAAVVTNKKTGDKSPTFSRSVALLQSLADALSHGATV